MNLHQKIIAVRKSVGYVQRNSEVRYGGQSYKGTRHDDVMREVRGEMNKQGIVMTASVAECETEKQGNMHWCKVKVRMSFFNDEDPKDSLHIDVWAQGMDSGDKGIGKAYSMAVKNGLIKILLLETGEDEESRAEEAKRDKHNQEAKKETAQPNNPISEEEAAAFRFRLKSINRDEVTFLKWFNSKNQAGLSYVSIDDVDSLGKSSIDKALKAWEKKAADSASIDDVYNGKGYK